MVKSFMLHWTGDIIHYVYPGTSKRLPHHCPGSVEKPDQERVFVVALSENIQRINY